MSIIELGDIHRSIRNGYVSPAVAPSEFIEDTLRKRVLFITGKGGVGKSTLSKAIALRCSQKGAAVALVTLVPAVSPVPTDSSTLAYLSLDPLDAFREYTLKILRLKSLYDLAFENRIFRTFFFAAPGLSDTVIAGKIWDLYFKGSQDLLIVDLPSSGHALSFFRSPMGVEHLFTRGFVHTEAKKIVKMFESPRTRLDVVTIPEDLPTEETLEFTTSLRTLCRIQNGFVHLNQVVPEFAMPDAETLGKNEAFRPICVRYLEQKRGETECRKRLSSLGLKILTYPKLAFSDSQNLTNDLSKLWS